MTNIDPQVLANSIAQELNRLTITAGQYQIIGNIVRYLEALLAHVTAQKEESVKPVEAPQENDSSGDVEHGS